MEIVKIECPGCGATPEVNKDLEFGYCLYCGTKIYIPNAVQKIKGTVSIDHSSEIDNYLKRAAGYETAGEFDKADQYYERVLDIDVENETANARRPLLQIKKAQAFEQKRNIGAAEQILEKAIRLYPEDSRLRSELQRIQNTVYEPNVTVFNRTKDRRQIFEVLEDGSLQKVADIPKGEDARHDLTFQVGPHRITAGKTSDEFDFFIDSNRTHFGIVLESRLFRTIIKTADPNMAQTPQKDPFQITCPKCKSTSISVQIIETGTETIKQGIGVKGHVNNMARGFTALGTLGMSNIVWKKSKPTEQRVPVNTKICICQRCGHSWEKDD